MAKNHPGGRKRPAAAAPSPPGPKASDPPSLAATTSPRLTAGGWAQPPAPPSSQVAQGLTIAIMLHGALIAITYLAVVRPSMVQGRVIDGFAPYLASLHLAPETNTADAVAAEGMSFYLVRGEGQERALRLQFKATTERGEEGWEDADFGGAAGSGRLRRQQRYLAVLATLGENEQNAMIARLILPLVAKYPEAQMVRVTRLPNVMTNVVQEAEPPPYTAAILRSEAGVRLVRVPPPRLGSAVDAAPANDSPRQPEAAGSGVESSPQGQVTGGQS